MDPELGFLQSEGVAHQSDLLRLGFTRAQIRHRLGTKQWQQILPQTYVMHSGQPSHRQRCLGATQWAGKGAALSGPTAAAIAGLKGYEDRTINVTVPYSRPLRSPAKWLVVHRSRNLVQADYVHGNPPRIESHRAVLETAAMRLRAIDAIAVVAAGVQQQVVAVVRMRPVLARLGKLQHRGAILDAFDDIEGGSQSLPEREVIQICRRHGLPLPSRQVVRAFEGRRRYLDTYWDEWRVCAEIDGQFHMLVERWIDDCDRGNDIAIAGSTLLRFPAFVVRHDEQKFVRTLRRALTAAGCPGL